MTAGEVKGIVWLTHVSSEATSPSHASGQRTITRVGAGPTHVSPPSTSNELLKVSPSESMKISQRLWLWEVTARRTPGSESQGSAWWGRSPSGRFLEFHGGHRPQEVTDRSTCFCLLQQEM